MYYYLAYIIFIKIMLTRLRNNYKYFKEIIFYSK